MEIFGVPIDNLTGVEVREKIEAFLREPLFHRIATVNPEFLLLAEKNPAFKRSLLAADLRLADGFGLYLPFWLSWISHKSEKLKARIPGADLVPLILHLAEKNDLAVHLVLRPDGLSTAKEIEEGLQKTYPKLHLVDTLDQAIVVLNNFGAPLQEMFLESLRTNPGPIRLTMGVGGSFDFLTGKVRRSPRWLRNLGLEWLWRLILQPKRWCRIWKAVFVFPFKACQEQRKRSR